MRVTNQMISGRVVFNLQRSMSRFLRTQTDMSTGRRINTPSDDPVGTVRDLGYRGELANIAQWQKNIDQAKNWSDNYESTLGELKDFVSQARELAVAMADGTYDANAREATANEVQSIFDQMFQLSNNELEGQKVFGGFRSQIAPFRKALAGVEYLGDTGAIDFEIEAQQKLTVNLNGQETFLKQLTTLGGNADLDVGLNAATTVANLRNGAGISAVPGTFTVTDHNTGLAATINIAAPPVATIQDVIDRINTQLTGAGITNLTATISDAKNSLKLDATANGLVSANTLLARINAGNGVDLTPGMLHVSNGGGIDFNVDLTGATSLGEVITKFNTQVAAQGITNVTMSVNAAGTGLQIDDTNAVPLGLTISDLSDLEQTAANLGIAGAVSPQLIGRALDPTVDFEVTEAGGTTAADLGIAGRFYSDKEGRDLDPRLTAASRMADLNNGLGPDRSSFVIYQGNSSLSIDLSDPSLVTVNDLLNRINTSGLSVTAAVNPSGRGIQITNNDQTKSLLIQESGAGRAAKDMGLYGSSDIMGTITAFVNALKNDDQEGAGLLLDGLDKSIQQLLSYRSLVGSRSQRLDSTQKRLADNELNFTKLLSAVEDADLPSLVTELSTQENNYRAALIATDKIIQPSLLDFLSR